MTSFILNDYWANCSKQSALKSSIASQNSGQHKVESSIVDVKGDLVITQGRTVGATSPFSPGGHARILAVLGDVAIACNLPVANRNTAQISVSKRVPAVVRCFYGSFIHVHGSEGEAASTSCEVAVIILI
jgi:hypothetical protein